jgi:hypothetical protein
METATSEMQTVEFTLSREVTAFSGLKLQNQIREDEQIRSGTADGADAVRISLRIEGKSGLRQMLCSSTMTVPRNGVMVSDTNTPKIGHDRILCRESKV